MVRLHGNRLPSVLRNFVYNFVRVLLAGRVIDDDLRAFLCELFGDCGADAFGRAGDDRDFAVKFSVPHFAPPLANASANCPTRPAKGISSAAYRSPASGLALSLSISTATVA